MLLPGAAISAEGYCELPRSRAAVWSRPTADTEFSESQGSCDADSENCEESSTHSMYSSHSNSHQNSKTDPSRDIHSAKKESQRTQELKILSFNIWNTNVVHGGSSSYIRRIQHIGKVNACYMIIFNLCL